jgi:hypothetical protein
MHEGNASCIRVHLTHMLTPPDSNKLICFSVSDTHLFTDEYFESLEDCLEAVRCTQFERVGT